MLGIDPSRCCPLRTALQSQNTHRQGLPALKKALSALHNQPMASAALTEGQVSLDTSLVGRRADAADSRAPKARVSDGGL